MLRIALTGGIGSGKTAVLVTRTITWILDVGWERHSKDTGEVEEVAVRVLKRVLALTFTRRAAVAGSFHPCVSWEIPLVQTLAEGSVQISLKCGWEQGAIEIAPKIDCS